MTRADFSMIRVRSTDREAEGGALVYLAGRFSFKTWAADEMLVPEPASVFLAREGIFLRRRRAGYL
jgi:hypothetical protein